jgi:hypothetical protein
MTISQGQFAGFFSRNIRCIDSTGQIHLYMDRPNQTPVYFVMVGGKVQAPWQLQALPRVVQPLR